MFVVIKIKIDKEKSMIQIKKAVVLLSFLLMSVSQLAYSADHVYEYQDYTWSQGDAAVYMGPTSDRICYLSGVTGEYRGRGEWVWVSPSSGSYYLTGDSSSRDVKAWARCVMNPKGDVNGDITISYWAADEDNAPTTYMKNYYDSNCFLTGFKGKFQGKGEVIEIVESQLFNTLKVYSGQKHVEGKAACVERTSADLGTVYKWNQGAEPLTMQPTDTHVCYLTRVSGDFDGHGEKVSITESGSKWVLSGASEKKDVTATAKCVTTL